jgi:hypothetical protein
MATPTTVVNEDKAIIISLGQYSEAIIKNYN